MLDPVIGIATAGHLVAKPFGDLPIVGSPAAIVDHIAGAGARPVLLAGADLVATLHLVDAIVLTGGGDIDPRRYGHPSESATDVDPKRDEAETALVRAAAQVGVPVLGVCRGMQLLVVAFGGTLRPDLGQTHVLPEGTHPIDTRPGSVVRKLLGHRPEVSSLHHQAPSEFAPQWQATAWAQDGVVEAIEWVDNASWTALGVQWHPEFDPPGHSAIFDWLVRGASNRSLSTE